MKNCEGRLQSRALETCASVAAGAEGLAGCTVSLRLDPSAWIPPPGSLHPASQPIGLDFTWNKWLPGSPLCGPFLAKVCLRLCLDIVKSEQLGSERSAGKIRTKRSFKLVSHGATRKGWGKPQLHLARAAAGWARIAQAVAIWVI